MIKVPESNRTIDLCCNWYYSVLEARKIDYFSGLPEKLTWEDVKSLVGYKFCQIPTHELAAIVFVIDDVYISTLSKQKQDADK